MAIFIYTARNHKNRRISGEYTASTQKQLEEELAKMGLKVTSAKLREEKDPFSLWDIWYGITDALEAIFTFLLPKPKPKYNPNDYKKTRAYIRGTLAKGNTDRMPTFCYVAYNEGGGTISGEMEAKDAADLTNRLKLINLTLIRVALDPTKEEPGSGWAKSLPPSELLILSQQLELYFTLDMTVPQMLDAIRQSCGSRPLKALLWRISNHMRQGDNFSQAVNRYPSSFNRFFLGVVETGQRTGSFPLVFRYAHQHLTWLISTRQNLIKAFRWPVFSNLVTWGIFATKALIYLLLPLLIYAAIRSIRNHIPAAALAIDRALLRWGAIGRCWMRYDTANFVYMFGVMWRAGLPIDEILTHAQKVMYNYALREAVDDIRAEVKRGELLSEAFRASGMFPAFVLSAVRLGEQTGMFELSLDEVYYFYTRALDDIIHYLIAFGRVVLLLVASLPILHLVLTAGL